jgi:predicted amidohydrolase YtcJ
MTAPDGEAFPRSIRSPPGPVRETGAMTTAMTTVYRAGAVHSPDHPAATALVVDDGRVAWAGPAGAVRARSGEPAVVDLEGTLVTPAFVDAHVHVTETGLLLGGVDLSAVRSLTALLDLVAAAATEGPVLGHGWDETLLLERRPPLAAELERAAPGATVYLSRVDGHSAVISPALAGSCGAPALPGWSPDGRVERDAHHAARDATRDGLAPAARRQAQLAALRAAAAAGIAAVHEMSAPHVASEEDLRALVGLSAEADQALPQVVAYRGTLVRTERQARELIERLGVPVAGLAGDLCVDGSVGSRTAAWHQGYADAPGTRGHLYLDVDEIRDHVAACTLAGVQAGFHVIGDAAVDAACRGIRRAAEQVGIAAVRAARHRLEHAEAIDRQGIADLADLGVIASVQPGFDARWGGDGGMYAARLGTDRAAALNPLAALARTRVAMAFGSDSPVTPFDPWGAVRAATHHHVRDQRLDLDTAFAAHTTGGWRAARVDGAGRLTRGAPATFAVWDVGAAAVPGRWPDLDATPRPRCLLTVRDGQILHDAR